MIGIWPNIQQNWESNLQIPGNWKQLVKPWVIVNNKVVPDTLAIADNHIFMPIQVSLGKTRLEEPLRDGTQQGQGPPWLYPSTGASNKFKKLKASGGFDGQDMRLRKTYNSLITRPFARLNYTCV